MIAVAIVTTWPWNARAEVPLAAATTGTHAEAGVLVPLPGEPPTRRDLALLLAPAWLSVGFVRLDAALRVSNKLGVKAVMATFGDFRLVDNVFGAQVNYYLFGRFERGWQLGVEYVSGTKRSEALFGGAETSPRLSAPLLEIVLTGAHVGYKYTARSGLTIELQAGVHATRVQQFDGDQQLSSTWSALPVVATNFGWSI